RHTQHDVIEPHRTNQSRFLCDASLWYGRSSKAAGNAEQLKLDSIGVADHADTSCSNRHTLCFEFLAKRLGVITINERAVMIDPRRRAWLPVRAEGDVTDPHRDVITQRLHGLLVHFRIEYRSIKSSRFLDVRNDHSEMLEACSSQRQLRTCRRLATLASTALRLSTGAQQRHCCYSADSLQE